MKLYYLYFTSLAVLHSFVTAAAVPDPAPRSEDASTLAKRGTEVNYLTNCKRVNGSGFYPASYMAWYANSDYSLNRERPSSLSNEYRDWSTGGNVLDWTKPQSIYFSDSGVSVNTNLASWAWNAGFGNWAGTATRTSDGKTFTCYRDNDRQLFNWTPPVPDGSNRSIECYANFWCT